MKKDRPTLLWVGAGLVVPLIPCIFNARIIILNKNQTISSLRSMLEFQHIFYLQIKFSTFSDSLMFRITYNNL